MRATLAPPRHSRAHAASPRIPPRRPPTASSCLRPPQEEEEEEEEDEEGGSGDEEGGSGGQPSARGGQKTARGHALDMDLMGLLVVGDKSVPAKVLRSLADTMLKLVRDPATSEHMELYSELLTEAISRMWQPHCTTLLTVLDDTGAQLPDEEVLSLTLHTLCAMVETAHRIELDDPILLATVALRLGTLYVSPHVQDCREAIQVLRKGLESLRGSLGTLLSFNLHRPENAEDHLALAHSACGCFGNHTHVSVAASVWTHISRLFTRFQTFSFVKSSPESHRRKERRVSVA